MIACCAVLLLVPLLLKSRMSQDIPARTAFYILSSGRLLVKIRGDLRHPGIYEVPANTMAIDVIKMAVLKRPLKLTNNSEAHTTLRNGSEIKLELRPDGTHSLKLGYMTVSEQLVLKIPLDIASMSEADFDRLPGVGPALARRIIDYRQNNGGILHVEDLNMVEGIGKKKFAALSGYFQHAETTK